MVNFEVDFRANVRHNAVMKSFNCPYCQKPIIASQVPTGVGAAAAGSVKSAAKAESSRRNGKLSRKPVATGPGNPEPAALVAGTAPAGRPLVEVLGEPEAGEARVFEALPPVSNEARVSEPVMGENTPCAEAGVRPITMVEAKKLAWKLKPLHTAKVRDYSGAYS